MLVLDAVTIFLGLRNSGKSTLARKLALGYYPRICVFDTKDEWKDWYGRKLNLSINYTLAGFKKSLADDCEKNTFLNIFKCGYLPGDDDERVAAFDEAIGEAAAIGDVLIYVDEAHMWLTKHYLPPHTRRAITMGRSDGVSMFFIAQRPAELHSTALSQAETIYCGRMGWKDDIRAMSQVMGDHAALLRDLKQGQFLEFSPGAELRRVDAFAK